jgi:gluconolactonase
VIRVDKKGRIEVAAELIEGKKLNGPNDIVVRKDGHAYFTDPVFGTQSAARELDYCGIYHVNPRDQVEAIARLKTRPNGIALAPNGRILYVADSDERSVNAYDLDGRGAASNERVFVKGIAGVPDGLASDEKGNIYVAARNLVVYSPAGALLHTIEMGEPPRNLEWGDADLMSLYVTSYATVYRIRLNVKGAVQH